MIFDDPKISISVFPLLKSIYHPSFDIFDAQKAENIAFQLKVHFLQILTWCSWNAGTAPPEPITQPNIKNSKRRKMCPDFAKKSKEKGQTDQILQTFEKLASDNFSTVLTLPVRVFQQSVVHKTWSCLFQLIKVHFVG